MSIDFDGEDALVRLPHSDPSASTVRLVDRDKPRSVSGRTGQDDRRHAYTNAVAKLTKAWFAARPRWRAHYTPVHASWVNQVELSFFDSATQSDPQRKLQLPI